jgi:hypothetical protein
LCGEEGEVHATAMPSICSLRDKKKKKAKAWCGGEGEEKRSGKNKDL